MREPVDARSDRLAQTIVGVVLLAAFVFRVPWLLPLIALILAAGAVGGPEWNPFHRAFDLWIAPRIEPESATLDAALIRMQDIIGAGVLGVATLAWVTGLTGVAWLLALAEAIIAIVAATTQLHVASFVIHRSR